MSKYEQRGVSADKHEVHAAIKNLDKGLFPNAFCKILPDFLGQDAEYCNLMHADTAGTKTSLAYIYWRETGDLSVWAGIVQDAIVMNLDDMGCVGCTDNFMLSSTIGRNKNLVSGAVLSALIEGQTQFCNQMAAVDIQIHLAGGETADVGDIVRTADVGFTAVARMKREDVISCNIQPNAWVVGLSSAGKAHYEQEYNSGMGSNGLTSARHDVLSSVYRSKYPDSFDANMQTELAYAGQSLLTDLIEVEGQKITLGKLLLSPTRTFLPYLKPLLPLLKGQIQGIIHNTGGGASKVLKFLSAGVKVVKDNPLPVPPIFNLIAAQSGAAAEELYKVFNMGCRLELYLDSEAAAEQSIALATDLGLEAQLIGRTRSSAGVAQVEQHTKSGQVIVYQ